MEKDAQQEQATLKEYSDKMVALRKEMEQRMIKGTWEYAAEMKARIQQQQPGPNQQRQP
jgi:hypothetical protein